MTLQRVRHISLGIERPYEAVYGFLSNPENFPKWASGLGKSFQPAGEREWLADTPMGRLRVRFSEENDFGVLDHSVLPEQGEPVRNPMRVLSNGSGSEVVFSLFQRPGMTDEEFARDAAWVEKDLVALKALLEER